MPCSCLFVCYSAHHVLLSDEMFRVDVLYTSNKLFQQNRIILYCLGTTSLRVVLRLRRARLFFVEALSSLLTKLNVPCMMPS